MGGHVEEASGSEMRNEMHFNTPKRVVSALTSAGWCPEVAATAEPWDDTRALRCFR